MVNLFFQSLILRHVSRNEALRKVRLVRGKFQCECSDETFTGLPCRHILSIASRGKDYFKNLHLQKDGELISSLRLVTSRILQDYLRSKRPWNCRRFWWLGPFFSQVWASSYSGKILKLVSLLEDPSPLIKEQIPRPKSYKKKDSQHKHTKRSEESEDEWKERINCELSKVPLYIFRLQFTIVW